MKKSVSTFLVLVFLLVGIFLFCHSTPERTIRTYLFFDGHMIDSIRTEVFPGRIDLQYGEQYCTKNPAIGPDFISVDKGVMGLWFVNKKTSGGG